MIARIRNGNGFYDSIVFAIYNNGWRTKALVFDRSLTYLRFVKFWLPSRNVFIYNTEKENWIKKLKSEGYDWVLKSLHGKLFKTKINKDMLCRCKEVQASVKRCEWFEIKNEKDIDGLMYAALDFHDSYVKKMHADGDKQYVVFDTTWGCDILFELDGKVETSLSENSVTMAQDNECLEILDSIMFIQDGLIFWVADNSYTSADEIQKDKDIYFCAQSVRWKLIIHDSKYEE